MKMKKYYIGVFLLAFVFLMPQNTFAGWVNQYTDTSALTSPFPDNTIVDLAIYDDTIVGVGAEGGCSLFTR